MNLRVLLIIFMSLFISVMKAEDQDCIVKPDCQLPSECFNDLNCEIRQGKRGRCVQYGGC
ncbi:hypothetical protein Anas_11949 [Armadillidium nasatum]|uniref:Uncharacterized protein n=1 Tax=Armadillidium nasatum TaxID=96803 RepID=A0A5N5T208_9CRUS|nr:hypothetical protein Anas_11949 [Armadillidium nasatum]